MCVKAKDVIDHSLARWNNKYAMTNGSLGLRITMLWGPCSCKVGLLIAGGGARSEVLLARLNGEPDQCGIRFTVQAKKALM